MTRQRLPDAVVGGMMTAATLLTAPPAAADWTGKGEVGIALASGNTDSQTANARVAVRQKLDSWEYTGTFAVLYVRNEGDTTARRWELGSEGRYSFTQKTFVFGGGRYEQDHFSGFDHQGVINMGVGHRFFDSEATKLSVQAGVGYKFWEKLDAASPRIIMDETDHLAAVAGVDFRHQITETTSVFNRFGAEITSGNNFLQNEVGVAVRVSGRLALTVAYSVRHNTDPPQDFRKTDMLSTVSLAYEVK
jgi:putative salt-induced outer membrane protein